MFLNLKKVHFQDVSAYYICQLQLARLIIFLWWFVIFSSYLSYLSIYIFSLSWRWFNRGFGIFVLWPSYSIFNIHGLTLWKPILVCLFQTTKVRNIANTHEHWLPPLLLWKNCMWRLEKTKYFHLPEKIKCHNHK